MSKQTTKEWVEAKINHGKKVVVFSKTYCPFCHKAKAALEKHKQAGEVTDDEIEIIEIEHMPNGNEIQDILQKKTGARSVPRVFVNHKFLGGGDETAKASRDGVLSTLLTQK